MPPAGRTDDHNRGAPRARDEVLRTTFCSSELVRLVGTWVPLPPDEGAMDVAERLSLALGPLDAIALQAANQQVRAGRFATHRTPGTLAARLRDDADRVRGALAHAIAQPPEPFIEVPLPAPAGERAKPASPAEAIGAGYQRRHAALQRQMEQMVGALRDHVRQQLAGASPRLQKLAVLDAALEKVLAAREQAALARLGRLLEQRFRSARKAHERALQDCGMEDDPRAWEQPGGWLHDHAAQWRQALLAERDLRMNPVDGLLAAVVEDTGP